VWGTGTAGLVDEPFGPERLEVAADLVELLARVAHDLACFADVVQVGGEFEEAEFPSGSLLGYSGVGGHSVLLW
jgi:hypothetical protein